MTLVRRVRTVIDTKLPTAPKESLFRWDVALGT